MTPSAAGRLAILSGPSCVGKSPLDRALARFHPDRHRRLQKVVLFIRQKLLRRTRRQKGELSLKGLENIERRAGSAFRELREAVHFEWVIPNHDGEDNNNWEAFSYPLGDARRALLAFADLPEGCVPSCAEKWEAGLLD